MASEHQGADGAVDHAHGSEVRTGGRGRGSVAGGDRHAAPRFWGRWKRRLLGWPTGAGSAVSGSWRGGTSVLGSGSSEGRPQVGHGVAPATVASRSATWPPVPQVGPQEQAQARPAARRRPRSVDKNTSGSPRAPAWPRRRPSTDRCPVRADSSHGSGCLVGRVGARAQVQSAFGHGRGQCADGQPAVVATGHGEGNSGLVCTARAKASAAVGKARVNSGRR